jgi:hypothetical protein
MAVQLCNLQYSELNELSGRLFVLAEHTLADRQAAADMRNAARAISDLSSARFGIEELADKLSKFADQIEEWYGTRTDYRIYRAVVEFANELCGLIGRSVEDEERL